MNKIIGFIAVLTLDLYILANANPSISYHNVILQELNVVDETFLNVYLEDIVSIQEECLCHFSYQIVVKCYNMTGDKSKYILLFEELDYLDKDLYDKLKYYFIYKGVMFVLLDDNYPLWIFSVGNKSRTLLTRQAPIILDGSPLRYIIFCYTTKDSQGNNLPFFHLIENRCARRSRDKTYQY